MSNDTPVFYLPIEVAARELDARLLLAHQALSAGCRVVVGQQWATVANLTNVRPGVVFFKGINRIQTNWMTHARKGGHRIVAIDEEATAICDPDFVVKECNPALLELADAIFMQGAFQHRIYAERFPHAAARFRITGNPRWDLLREQFRHFFTADVAGIRERFGRFILINTNFGFVNTSWGKPQDFIRICVNVGYVDPKSEADKKWLNDQFQFERENLKGFRDMALRLEQRYPDHTIILRPHPSENIERWRNALAGRPRVQVVSEGSAIPWILASDLLVHNTCTTGVEAFVLDHPTIAYCPYTNWCESIFTSNVVTPRADTLDELYRMTDLALSDRQTFIDQSRILYRATLDEHFSYLTGASSTEQIFREMLALGAELPRVDVAADGVLRAGASYADKRLEDYQRAKISLTAEQVAARFRQLVTSIGQHADPRIETIGDSLFLMHP